MSVFGWLKLLANWHAAYHISRRSTPYLLIFFSCYMLTLIASCEFRYLMNLSDVHMMVCGMRDKWQYVSGRTGGYNVVDKFSITIQMERYIDNEMIFSVL